MIKDPLSSILSPIAIYQRASVLPCAMYIIKKITPLTTVSKSGDVTKSVTTKAGWKIRPDSSYIFPGEGERAARKALRKNERGREVWDGKVKG